MHNKVQEVAKQYNIILLQWQKKTSTYSFDHHMVMGFASNKESEEATKQKSQIDCELEVVFIPAHQIFLQERVVIK